VEQDDGIASRGWRSVAGGLLAGRRWSQGAPDARRLSPQLPFSGGLQTAIAIFRFPIRDPSFSGPDFDDKFSFPRWHTVHSEGGIIHLLCSTGKLCKARLRHVA